MIEPLRWGVLGASSLVHRSAVRPALVGGELHTLILEGSRSGPVSYEDVLADERVEAVYVPLPNGLHREWVERAAAAGKHALCEKPLAVEPDDARAMADACAAAGVVLAEAYMSPFHPRSEAIAATIRSGRLGQLRSARTGFTFPHPDPTDHRFDPELGGGALLDVGIYCLAPLLAAAGRTPVGVSAVAARNDAGVETSLTGLLDLGDGFAATIEVSFEQPERQYLEVVGTRAALAVDRAFTPGADDTTFLIVDRDGTAEEVVTGGGDCYAGMVDAFALAVRGEAAFPRSTDEAIALLDVVARLRAAARP